MPEMGRGFKERWRVESSNGLRSLLSNLLTIDWDRRYWRFLEKI